MTMAPVPLYIPSPPRGVWHLGPLPIRAYALFIIVGIVVALVISDRRWARRGGERGVVYDIALWVVPFGLIGGRLYHLATDWQTYFAPGGAGFAAALRIWDGGLGIWGAVALGAVGGWIGCRRHGIPLPALMDAVAPGLVLAQAIGRLGNYFNQELYGRETTLPWGLEIFYRRDPAGYVDPHSLDGVSTGQLAFVVQPTFLYELLWNIVVFGLLIYLDRKYVLAYGRLFATYVALYCVGRFWVELLRDDTATHIAGIRINSFTSTFVFIGSVVFIILAPKGREDPETLRGFEDEEEEAKEPELAAVGASSGAAAPAGDGGVEADHDEEPAGPEVAAEEPEADDAPEAEVTEPAEPEVAETEEEAAPDEPAEAQVEEPAAEVGGPEAAEPELGEPEAVEPEVAEPAETERAPAEIPEPEPAQAESAEPEAAPGVPVEPELVEPEAVEPEAVEPETAEPEPAEAEAPEEPAEAEACEEPAAAEAAEVPEPEAEAAEESPLDAEPEADEADKPADEDAAPAEAPQPETPVVDGETPAKRRWGLRRRNRG
jgi:prolipoprotein diacylglyceryl transferase